MIRFWKKLAFVLALALVLTCLPATAWAAEGDSPAEPAAAQTAEYPASLYLTQSTGYTCTLASSAMMLRARMYLSGSDQWDAVTEASLRPQAWLSGTGIYANFTCTVGDDVMTVTRQRVSGISLEDLKALLDEHPEGIVFYISDRSVMHAVYVTDYEGDTIYCADPAVTYSGTRRALSTSQLGNAKGSQESVLRSATAYWYVSSYSIASAQPEPVEAPEGEAVLREAA